MTYLVAQFSIVVAIACYFGTHLRADEPSASLPWQVLAGPEKENGEPVEIVEQSKHAMTLSVAGRRGTIARHLTPTDLPAELSFDIQTVFDDQASEPPTELFGTGDFRIFVG